MKRSKPLKPSGRDTGPNGATRIQVIMRDESRCVRCGMAIRWGVEYSIHHRLPRGRGGENRLSNLILLCGSGTTGCHGWIESHREDSYIAGWVVRTGEKPEEVPIRGWWLVRVVLLDNNGSWTRA